MEKVRQQIYELIKRINDEHKLKIILQFIRGIKGS